MKKSTKLNKNIRRITFMKTSKSAAVTAAKQHIAERNAERNAEPKARLKGNATFGFSDYFKIEEDLKTDMSYQEIADKYKTSRMTISRVHNKQFARYDEKMKEFKEFKAAQALES
jgi:hypothetical protein